MVGRPSLLENAIQKRVFVSVAINLLCGKKHESYIKKIPTMRLLNSYPFELCQSFPLICFLVSVPNAVGPPRYA